MKVYVDQKYHFFELFNEKNGTLVRSNIEGTNKDALCRSFPELIDIGIMGSCEAGRTGICKNAGVDCYQKGYLTNRKNMSVEDYKWIMDQCKNKVFQVALGGAGDPNKHENFEQILKITREHEIVPNLTISGYQLRQTEIDAIKKYCGAVAVSYYSRLVNNKENNNVTCEAIDKLIEAGCITNIHYVISNDTIDEAIYRLKNNIWPKGINAIIFILYKPVGMGIKNKKVKNDYRLVEFLKLALKRHYLYKVGFDTCFATALYRYDDEFAIQSIDSCEAARFSMYIDSELRAYPCSFDNQKKEFGVSLIGKTIQEIWNSDVFNDFRNIKKNKCTTCVKSNVCNNGCHLKLDIDLC